jgi:hypothetical protein
VTAGKVFRRHRRGHAGTRGQGLVEFALVLPVTLLILVGLVDFGFAFYTDITLKYASREGARVGSALAAGGGTLPCAEVDDHVMAAIQRVIESAGISVRADGVQWIRLYKATNNADGSGWAAGGTYNEWTYAAGGGPTVDGTVLDYRNASSAWSACSRKNGSSPDAIGVAISYTHQWNIPLGPFTSDLALLDRTVMVLNPTYP